MPRNWGYLRALFDEEAGGGEPGPDGFYKNRGFSIERPRMAFFNRGVRNVPGWKGGVTYKRVEWAKRVIEIWAGAVAMYGQRQGKVSVFPKEPVYEQRHQTTPRSASAAAAYEAACVRNLREGGGVSSEKAGRGGKADLDRVDRNADKGGRKIHSRRRNNVRNGSESGDAG